MDILPEDYIAISELVARYCMTLNLHDTEGWVDLFTEDASYKVYGRSWDGHEGLRKMISATSIGLHLGGQPTIALVDNDNARATRCMWVHFPSDGSTRSAIYEDEVRRTPLGWRFAGVRCQFITAEGLRDRPPRVDK